MTFQKHLVLRWAILHIIFNVLGNIKYIVSFYYVLSCLFYQRRRSSGRYLPLPGSGSYALIVTLHKQAQVFSNKMQYDFHFLKIRMCLHAIKEVINGNIIMKFRTISIVQRANIYLKEINCL